jgi:23S rRNA-/tRNA-specific pseudouridylate synthase
MSPETLASVEVLMDDNDDGIAALNKPAGMLTHASEGAGKSATLVDAAMDIFSGRLSELNGADKRGVVSRLDKPTSGVVILAKTDAAHAELCTQYYQRDVQKTYVALVDGVLTDEGGEIHTPLDNRPATSVWKRIDTFESTTSGASFSLVEVQPKSGRYHQIRQHMASIGHPLTGDVVYRRKTSSHAKAAPKCVVEALARGKPGTIFFLHCAKVSLIFNGRERVIEAPLPAAFETLLARLRSEM